MSFHGEENRRSEVSNRTGRDTTDVARSLARGRRVLLGNHLCIRPDSRCGASENNKFDSVTKL